jgi:hypothetical protein
VHLDDHANDGKSEAHAFLLGGEVRLKDVAACSGATPGPRSATAISTPPGCARVSMRTSRLARGSPATAWIAFGHQVDDDLLQLDRVAGTAGIARPNTGVIRTSLARRLGGDVAQRLGRPSALVSSIAVPVAAREAAGASRGSPRPRAASRRARR